VSDLDRAGQRFRRPATPEKNPNPASYQLPDSVAAASGRWTKNSPLLSALTVDVFVCPASSSKDCSENGDRNKIPIAEESATNPSPSLTAGETTRVGAGVENT
jgi:hypothetical protein